LPSENGEIKAMEKNVWIIVKSVLFDKRVVFSGFLLLAIVFLDFLFLYPLFSELDILEHFLFGFVLSESASKSMRAIGLDERLLRRLNKGSVNHVDLLIRLVGFLLIGGLLWESFERFLFPMFGVKYNPFFALPITLYNIDGAIDVAVGTLGCITAWYTVKL